MMGTKIPFNYFGVLAKPRNDLRGDHSYKGGDVVEELLVESNAARHFKKLH